MDIRKGGFAIICCLTMVLSCQEEILLCPRPNMTCATAVCDCYVYFSNINRVFCTRVNLTDIPSEIPSTITYIEMNGNNITTIKNGSFRELPYLEKLFLSNNNIQNIEPGAFSDMSSLTTIDLYDNDIIILVAGIFRNLRVLQKIYIGSNKITTLVDGTFKDLPNLREINFNGNPITLIESYAFFDLHKLDTIRLKISTIERLEEFSFVNIGPVLLIDISYNKLSVIAKNTFVSTRVGNLVLSSNSIHTIEENAFVNTSVNDLVLSSNSIHTIKENAFVNSSVNNLVLIDNAILTIEDNAFVNVSISNLSLRNNRLTRIKKHMFTNISSLNYIDLSYNNISVIEGYGFYNLLQLTSFSVTGNPTQVVETNAFYNLPKLKIIDLSNFQIEIVHSEAFVDIPALERIDLKRNKLTTLYTNTFKDLPVHFIDLSSNPIDVIEKNAYYNLPNLQVIHSISPGEIESEAFVLLPKVSHIRLIVTKLTPIRRKTFWDLPGLHTIVLSGGNITKIEKYAFGNLPMCIYIILSNNRIEVIEQNAFVNVDAEIILNRNMIKVIEIDAFVNVHGTALVLGIAEGFVMKEYKNSTFNGIHFEGNFINCNCSFMWFSLLLQDQNTTSVYGNCVGLNRTIAELRIDDFVECSEQKSYTCSISSPVTFVCSAKYITSDFSFWMHSRNGKIIRKLNTLVVSIPFCSLDDAGEYTCVRRTNYRALPQMNSSVFLSINGPPTVLDQQTYEYKDYLVIAIVFYVYPYTNIPRWSLNGDEILPGALYQMETGTIPVTLNQYQTNVPVQGFRTNLTIYNHHTLPSTAYTCTIFNGFGEVEEVVLSKSVNVEIPRKIYCNVTFKVEIECSLNFVGGIPDLWIHSSGGQFIRSLAGTVKYNNTNVLDIPFCNHQDMGDYTCTWKTDIPNIGYINKTTTLSVNGPPLILSNSLLVDGGDTVLSVFFFSNPFPKAPVWYFNNKPVGTISKFLQATTYSTVQMRQYKAIVKQSGFISNLTIVESKYSGNFHVTMENMFGIARENFVVNKDDSTADSSTSYSPIIIGVVSSIIAIILLIVISAVVWRRKTKQTTETYNEPTGERPEEDGYDSIAMSQVKNNQSDDYIEIFE